MHWAHIQALAGIFPLAGFLFVHLLIQSSALVGWQPHRELSSVLDSVPLALGFEIVCIYVPLFVHVALGFGRIMKPGLVPPSEAGKGKRALQLSSAGLLLAFLLFHGWQFRWRLWTGQIDRADMFPELCASLSSTAFGGVPIVAAGYLLGMAAAAFHAAHGVYQACRAWNMVSPERQPALGRLCVAAGLGLFLLGALIIIDLATGSVVIHFPV
jgi:succinate dehydrogenase / fumarate reductase, cytochrome b subunit